MSRWPTDWRSEAACRDADPAIFYPWSSASATRSRTRKAASEALALCAVCPVVDECLADADGDGVRGGLVPAERLSRRFVCDECGNGFATTNALGAHRRSHERSFPYVCPDCGKGAESAQGVAVHRTRMHGGQPPEHGTPSGYHRHKRLGEDACRACLDAVNGQRRAAG